MQASSRIMPNRAVVMLVALLAAILAASWAASGQTVLAIAGALIVSAVFRPVARVSVLTFAAALLWGCVLALAWHFGADDFSVRYVWLYSSAELPLHLKIANVWGGDEGTTLLLAACCTTLAASAARATHDSERVSVGAGIAAWYCLTVLWLAPFAGTPADWLAQSPSQGMNAHLMKIWMLFHAPLVLAAYAWTLALAAPALDALRGRPSPWPAQARTRARRAWLVLTAGIGFGMVWAFEDETYGQVWHWDPVQTSAFCLWCFLTAHVHGIAGWSVGRRHWRLMPWAALLAAAMAPLAMAVTRNPMLASSHRYVGADSWSSHFVLGGALLFLALGCAVAGRKVGGGTPRRSAAAGIGLWLAQLSFLLAGAAAVTQLLFAFASAALSVPRPDEYKPFLAMLANVTGGSELAALRAAFDQWDVDGYVLARMLLLPLAAVGLVGGWYFFRRISVRAGMGSLALALLAMALSLALDGVLSRGYTGEGILSQRIVALLPMLDASLIGGAYLATGCMIWAALVWRRVGWNGVAASAPLAAIHTGVALMLWGGLLATALNTYTQHELRLDTTSSEWVQDRQGYSFRLADTRFTAATDGGVRGQSAIQAMTSVEVRDAGGEVMDGQTLYRDSRAPLDRYDGPMRQVCELLDYRYARQVGASGYLLQPLIDHGWRRTAQFWISPAALGDAVERGARPPVAVVVVKVFPFVSLLWVGLVLTVLGGIWLALAPQRIEGVKRGA